MRRISVVGNSASGKSTVARELSARLGLPWLELDSVYHQEGWTPLDADEFRRRVADFVARPAWVVDGNYTSQGVADLVWPRADTIVWLDPSLPVVLSRVVRRTLRRVLTRQELWNRNREPWSNLFDPRPERNIIVWALTRHRPRRQTYTQMTADGTWDHLAVHRLRNQSDIDGFFTAL